MVHKDFSAGDVEITSSSNDRSSILCPVVHVTEVSLRTKCGTKIGGGIECFDMHA